MENLIFTTEELKTIKDAIQYGLLYSNIESETAKFGVLLVDFEESTFGKESSEINFKLAKLELILNCTKYALIYSQSFDMKQNFVDLLIKLDRFILKNKK